MQSQEMDCWCFGMNVMVPHLIFFVHFTFSLKRFPSHSIFTIYCLYYYGGKDSILLSFGFTCPWNKHYTDCSQNFKRQDVVVLIGTPQQGYLGLRKMLASLSVSQAERGQEDYFCVKVKTLGY